jgi:CheY-like chemotaxis protein
VRGERGADEVDWETMAHKLLLADDSVTIQRVIELTFADEDVALTAVGDGRQAIEKIEADPPDIVLADVGMPEKDGYEVAAFIKNNPRYAHIPVLLLTGAFEPVDEERARAVGCDGVLAKPFEPQMVITRVKELLAGASRSSFRAPVAEAPEPGPAAVPFTLPDTPFDLPGQMGEVDVVSALEQYSAPAESGDPFSIESAFEAAVRINRRPSISVDLTQAEPAVEPEIPPADSGTPAPAEPVPPAEDYFARLDNAFKSLSQPPVSQTEAPLSLPWLSSGRETGTFDTESHGAPAFADSFSDLLAAEHVAEPDSPVPGPEPEPYEQTPPPTARAAVGPSVDEGLVARVTQDVLAQMSDRVVRETVTDVVSRIAERLIREEIDRIKAAIR